MPRCLTRLELQGYKTFVSKTEFEFGDVTCIVGPNGSGKSNIADGLRWVLGEQSYQLLRGRKTEDMIFSGSEKRPKASMAAVTVIFDNSDGWLPIEFSEVSLSRRAYRDGRNEYLLNGTKARLRDIADLLGKVGLARRTYTIIGQGLVDTALSLKADERRALFEEAAGIGTYRQKREESLRKLDATERNLERIQDIMSEIRPRLRALERQAKRAEEHQQALENFRATVSLWYGYHWHQANDLAEKARLETDARSKALENLRTSQESNDEHIARLRTQISSQRAKLNSKRSEATRQRNELETVRRQLAVAEERARNLEQHQRATSDQLDQFESILVAQRQRLSDARKDVTRLEKERIDLQDQLESAQEGANQGERERRAVSDRETNFRSQAADITQQITERDARRTVLRDRLVQLTEEGAELKQALQAGMDAVDELQDALTQQIRIAKHTRLAREDANHVASTKAEGDDGINSDVDKLVGRVSNALAEVERLTARQGRQVGDELSDVDAELEALEEERRTAHKQAMIEGARLDELSSDDLVNEISVLRTSLAVTSRALQDHSSRCGELADAFERDKRLVNERPSQTASLITELENLRQDIEGLRMRESLLQDQYTAIQGEVEPDEAEISSLESMVGENERNYASSRAALHGAERHCAAAEIEHERKQSKLASLRQQISDDFSIVGPEYTDAGEESISRRDAWMQALERVETLPEGLQDKVARVRSQVRRLGGINPEAVTEYTEVKERYDDLETQVEDLGLASDHLREVIGELDTLMHRDFHHTFEAVAKEFQYTFERLFGGGSAHLELTSPDDLSHTGIDIVAQLPGRREQGLALLSGGERSLTACALVFALLRISPTPFAMLDEVDAMLDEANIGRFREILVEIGQTTQFVVITHNRHTVEVADTVYGVSMGTDSASQVISLKLD